MANRRPLYGLDATAQWWREKGDDHLAGAVCAAAEKLDLETTDRQQAILRAFSFYEKESLIGSGAAESIIGTDLLGHNVLAHAVDGVLSDVTQSIPRPLFVTAGGTWDEQRQAEKMTAFVEAKFSEQSLDELYGQVMRDAIIAGVGCIRPFIFGDETAYERISPINLLPDDVAPTDTPRTLFIRHFMGREQLKAFSPGHDRAIDSAPVGGRKLSYAHNASREMVVVWEAWHLPSSPGESDDGRHCVAIPGALLVDEDYTRQRFPLAFIRCLLPVKGWWGGSMMMRGAPIQQQIDVMLDRMQKALHRYCLGRMFVAPGSLKATDITNADGAIVVCSGPPPTVMDTPPFPSQFMEFILWLVSCVYEAVGSDRYAATSQKPSGLNSGEAIRTHRDMQSLRFVGFERAGERLVCELARETVFLESALAEDNPSHEVLYKSEGATERIEWRSINLDEDRLRLECMPVSALPRGASGKLQRLEEMLAAGVIDQRTFLRLADIPDFKGQRDEVVAPENVIRRALGLMLDDDKTYLDPRPYWDLDAAMRLTNLQLQQAETRGCPEVRLDKLRRFMVDARELMLRGADAEAQQMMAAQAPPAGPPGMATPELASGALPVAPGSSMPPPNVVPPGGMLQ